MRKQENGGGFSRIFWNFARKLGSDPRLGAVRCFTLLTFLGFFVFSACSVFLGERAFFSIFHRGASDPFFDFFSSVRDAAAGPAVYSERRVIYPPLANTIFWLFSRVLGEGQGEGSAHLLPFLIFFTLCLVAQALLLASAVKGRDGVLFAIAATLSFPMIFLLERGNLALLSLLLLLWFACGLDAQDATVRESGLWALGAATALKIYPLLFCLPLIRARRWREVGRLLLYAFVLFLVPSFFFGGPLYCIKWLVLNTLHYSSVAAGGVTGRLGAWGLSPLAVVLFLIFGLLLLFLIFLYRALWGGEIYKSFAHLAAFLLCIPSIFSAYNWLLFLPALVLFFKTESLSRRNAVWFFLVSTPFFLYLPKPLQDNGLIALVGGIIAFSVIELLWERKARQRGEKSDISI